MTDLYMLAVDGERFDASAELCGRILPERRYRVFFTPKSRFVVAIADPVPPGTEQPSDASDARSYR